MRMLWWQTNLSTQVCKNHIRSYSKWLEDEPDKYQSPVQQIYNSNSIKLDGDSLAQANH